jgi:hypothetical protein
MMRGVTDQPTIRGGAIVNASWAGTGVFVVTAMLAAIVPDTMEVANAIFAGALFVIGAGAFLWAFAVAVSRSRTDAVHVPGVFFLSGTAPKTVRVRLWVPLVVEIVVAVTTAAIRPYSDLAFGILAPVYGLALMGLWGAKYGEFPPRPDLAAPAKPAKPSKSTKQAKVTK